MRTVKVKKQDLMERLQANRRVHRATFLKAQQGYRQMVIDRLDRMLADARAGQKIDQHVGLVEPIDQTRDYDRAISMLEMSVDDTIELTETEFACLVLDQWMWKQQFVTISEGYIGK